MLAHLEGAYVLKEGKLVDADAVATLPAKEHYETAVTAYQASDFKEAARQFRIVATCYPTSSYAGDALFYLGVAEYQLEELDFANEAFNDYLKTKSNPAHFQEAIQYKLTIAGELAGGSKRRLLGTRKLPKWACGKAMALKIYDEIIVALPCHDLGARALYEKGNLQWDLGDYRASIDAFQMLVKRFPKHELAPESYVAISHVYVDQSSKEYQNSDVLAFAQINLRRFKQDFPKEERIAQVEGDVLSIKEAYAQGLYGTGQFYERTGKPSASVIYYQKAIKQFPETEVAKRCRERLQELKPEALEAPAAAEVSDKKLPS